ncbi:MAG: DUF4097 family beta strand repeat-containing protein [Planctomycetota bacterium]
MNMPPDRRFAGLAAILLVGVASLSLAACRLSTASAEGTLSASVSDAKSLVVQNSNGSVEIVKDPATTDLQVSAKVRCAAESEEAAEARLKATKLVAERDPDGRVRVQVVFPPRGPAAGTVMLGGSGEGASLVIRAANLDGIQVDTGNGSITCGGFNGLAKLDTSNGSIRIEGHGGPVQLDTSNGAIEATRVGTPVVAKTSNGRVEVSLADTATGDVKIDTSNGRVELELPASWQGTVDADTSNGSIEASIPSAKVVRMDRGEATVTIGDGTKAKATVDTSNGRVTIRAATK